MKFKTAHSFWHKLFNSKVFFLGLLIIFVLTVMAIWREQDDYREDNQKISQLESEIAALTQESFDLQKLTEYLRGSEFVEAEAREKLNMVKDGEDVVMVPANERSNELVAGLPEEQNRRNNWQLWIDYLWGKETK